MFIKNLTAENFRNLQPLSLDLDRGFWVVLGSNGQGKSNLLEAVQTLCDGRSRRTEKERELVNSNHDWYRLAGRFVRERLGEAELGVRFSRSGKELFVFGSKVGRISQYMTEVSCVPFSADDAQIILGEPTERRSFLNEAISQSSHGYVHDLSRYRRTLEQKNRALKSVRERKAPESVLDVWDQQLSQYGGRVCARRARFVKQLAPLVAEIYGIIGGGEDLGLAYCPSVPEPEKPELWPEALAAAVASRRNDELIRGISLFGPQRDDLAVTIRGMDARAFASRGQARSAALALRLAEARLAHQQTGQWPILLMDDIFGELDGARRSVLARLAREAEQVFVTAADASDLPDEASDGSTSLSVSAGKVAVDRTI